MIAALAGGVGGAKLAHGLMLTAPDESLHVVVNTGDDFNLFGLRIAPDLDTVLYTLAGLGNPVTGWGIAGDTAGALEMMGRYGQETWFWLGDRDLATHILRTRWLGEGWTPTHVVAELARTLGVPALLLPMCDEPVATRLATPTGELDFQAYFVQRRQQDTVLRVRFEGIEQARVPVGVSRAYTEADLIVFCPSNPLVSIGPILAVPGMRDALMGARAPKVAVSPIVGGKALRGPADRMLASMGHEVSALGVARLYQGLVQGMVIDEVDADQRLAIEHLGMHVHVTDTVMANPEDRQRLALDVLAFGATLRGHSLAE
jgi:LPPG:FO 2-phospho-L-lactate transferase